MGKTSYKLSRESGEKKLRSVEKRYTCFKSGKNKLQSVEKRCVFLLCRHPMVLTQNLKNVVFSVNIKNILKWLRWLKQNAVFLKIHVYVSNCIKHVCIDTFRADSVYNYCRAYIWLLARSLLDLFLLEVSFVLLESFKKPVMPKLSVSSCRPTEAFSLLLDSFQKPLWNSSYFTTKSIDIHN